MWQGWMHRNMMSQRCLTGFRSGEWSVNSISAFVIQELLIHSSQMMLGGSQGPHFMAWGCLRRWFPRPSLIHHQNGQIGGCCRQQNVLHSISRLPHTCHSVNLPPRVLLHSWSLEVGFLTACITTLACVLLSPSSSCQCSWKFDQTCWCLIFWQCKKVNQIPTLHLCCDLDLYVGPGGGYNIWDNIGY